MRVNVRRRRRCGRERGGGPGERRHPIGGTGSGRGRAWQVEAVSAGRTAPSGVRFLPQSRSGAQHPSAGAKGAKGVVIPGSPVPRHAPPGSASHNREHSPPHPGQRAASSTPAGEYCAAGLPIRRSAPCSPASTTGRWPAGPSESRRGPAQSRSPASWQRSFGAAGQHLPPPTQSRWSSFPLYPSSHNDA